MANVNFGYQYLSSLTCVYMLSLCPKVPTFALLAGVLLRAHLLFALLAAQNLRNLQSRLTHNPSSPMEFSGDIGSGA